MFGSLLATYAFPAVLRGEPVLSFYRAGQLTVHREYYKNRTIIDKKHGLVGYAAVSQVIVTTNAGRVIYSKELERSLDPHHFLLADGMVIFSTGQTNITGAFYSADAADNYSYLNGFKIGVHELRSGRTRYLPMWSTGIPLQIRNGDVYFARLNNPRKAVDVMSKESLYKDFTMVRRSTHSGRFTRLGRIDPRDLDHWSFWSRGPVWQISGPQGSAWRVTNVREK